MDKHKRGIVLTIISVAILLVSSLIMFISTGSAAHPDAWHANWTPSYDSDYKNFYVNLSDGWRERHFCGNSRYSGCATGDLANNNVFSPPPTVVRWQNVGTINTNGVSFAYQEKWVAGDGLGSSLDFRFKQEGFAGTTGGRNHAWGLFTGDARLTSSGGEDMRLEYRWIFASEDNNTAFPPNCRNRDYAPSYAPFDCDVWLAWGDIPPSSISFPVTTGSRSNDDWKAHLAIFTHMEPGTPNRWMVTGDIL